MNPLLRLVDLQAYIGPFHILQGVSFSVPVGGITMLMGRNGAGKTTTLRTIMGQTRYESGKLELKGQNLAGLPPYQVARLGVGYVPEDQSIFPDLTVEENIRVAIRGREADAAQRIAFILDLFPDLKQSFKRKGGVLSGGQKQMLAIARAYASPNDLLLIDEPSKGLAPVMVEKVAQLLLELKQRTTILLVEQNFWLASTVGDSFVILEEGHTQAEGSMQDLLGDAKMRETLLGVKG